MGILVSAGRNDAGRALAARVMDKSVVSSGQSLTAADRQSSGCTLPTSCIKNIPVALSRIETKRMSNIFRPKKLNTSQELGIQEMKKIIYIVGFYLASLCLASSAHSVVLDFNGTATATADATTGPTYSEDGFTFTFDPFINRQPIFIDSGRVAFPGVAPFDDDVLEFNNSDTVAVLTRDGGGLFDLQSVLTGSLGRSLSDDGDFVFTGTFGIGGVISEIVLAVSAIIPNQTLFSGFVGLSSLRVTSNDGFFPVLDNLVVTPNGPTSVVPVPAALPLFGTGLAIMGFVGWRRKRKLA